MIECDKIARDKQWYRIVLKHHGITDINGNHFLMVPMDEYDDGFEDGFRWRLIHRDTLEQIEMFSLDEGETIEQLRDHLEKVFEGAHVTLPMFHARTEVHHG